MGRSVFLGKWYQNLVNGALANIHQHVCVGESLDGPSLVSLVRWKYIAVQWLATIVLLQDLFVGNGGDAIIIELEPPSIPIWLDKRKVVATMQITRVNEDAMQFVDMGL